VRKNWLCCILLAAAAGWGAIIADVRDAIARNDFGLGESRIAAYRAKNGVTPELIVAWSWLGRGALAAKRYDQAESYAQRTYELAQVELKRRKLDEERHLPIALGAAIEVQGQVLAARGERDNAVAYLRGELAKYAGTSIHARIRKNINLLSLEGKPAPAIGASRPLPRGKPLILFFWAHWCGDCKSMAPVLARIAREHAGRLSVLGVTQHYGYVAGGEEAPRAAETRYIEQVRQAHYPGLTTVVSEEAFNTYGCSTTPTIAVVDANGVVRVYHPGKMTYDELKAALARLMKT
jgi:thiol-disulfide isomerase/thioredoxin